MKKFMITSLVVGYAALSGYAATVQANDIAEAPLFLTNSAHPNLMFTMSVETPVGAEGYNDQVGIPDARCKGRVNWPGQWRFAKWDHEGGGSCYFSDYEYLGYFNSKKCYRYRNTETETSSSDTGVQAHGKTTSNTDGTFIPVKMANAAHECDGSLWSGNFLNWATYLAVDGLAYSMTGGNRVVDTAGKKARTVVRRSLRSGFRQSFYKVISNDPAIVSKVDSRGVSLSASVNPRSVTPFNHSSMYIRNLGISHKFEIGTFFFNSAGQFKVRPNASFTVQVESCNTKLGVENLKDNCKPYTKNGHTYYKPEGLVQENQNKMRFGVSSYLMDHTNARDGGVIRSNMKHVGAELPGTSGVNPKAEIAPDGTLKYDPDGLAGSQDVTNTGVINFLNKFSDYHYKSYDPFSELYYETIRFFKGKSLGVNPMKATAEYVADINRKNSENLPIKGGFPALVEWEDPMQYRCQKNFIVGISDVNTHRDKRLPGTFFTDANASMTLCNKEDSFAKYDCNPPSGADNTINVTELTNRIGELEGMNTNGRIGEYWAPNEDCATGAEFGCVKSIMKSYPNFEPSKPEYRGNGRQNSYYTAGLAHYANTKDLRGDFEGKQTVKTYLIDVQEYKTKPMGPNKFNHLWLAGKYGGFNDLNGNDIPDADAGAAYANANEFDSNKDGKVDGYILATEPETMVDGLRNVFSDIISLSASASAASVNTPSIRTGSKVYQSVFNSGNWTGSIRAKTLNPDGSVGSLEWSAQDQMPAERFRHIFSVNADGDEIVFKWSELTSADKAALENNEDILKYIRGDQSKEGSATGDFRKREAILGDIVNSSPVAVAAPGAPFIRLDGVEGSSYRSFLLDKKDRAEVVYAGANDGMMHGFNAATGKEVIAYVPNSVYPRLPLLTKQNYTHRYYVDGKINTGDAYLDGDWETVLVGTLGAGGKSVYALNITEPTDFATKPADDIVKWEYKGEAADKDYLGHIMGKAVITRLSNGKWAAVFGNGYNSVKQEASLFVVDLDTGDLIKRIDTGVGSSTEPNGLSEPALIDTNGDLSADYVYAGDLQGNVWKFDLSDDTSVSNWKVAIMDAGTPKPLFTAKVRGIGANGLTVTKPQPITARLSVMRSPNGEDGYMILFGTGRYMYVGDNRIALNELQNTVYGIWDRNNGNRIENGRDDLVEREITHELVGSQIVRKVTGPAIDYSSTNKHGWFMDLPKKGERVISRAQSQFDTLYFTTYTPVDDPCKNGGESWFMGLDAFNGLAKTEGVFDVDSDGTYDPDVAGIEIGASLGEVTQVCKDNSCEELVSISSSQDGELVPVTVRGEPTLTGRQSWRQIK